MQAGISDLLRTLLERRGVLSDEAVAAFLAPDYEAHTHSPLLFAGMEQAVERLLAAIVQDEHIAIYADFDCDGIPGAALFSDFLRKIGHTHFEVYMPHRDREGHGFHVEAVETLAKKGVKLIYTIDVGTNALPAAARAKELGVDVIISDHHEVTGPLPEVVAILNPKIAPYPYAFLCGAAVAYKFVQALLLEGRKRALPQFTAIPEGWEKWLLDLVAIATVGDMVPLTGENRALAHWGIAVLRKSQRIGIITLCNKLRLRKSELTEDDISFSIAPRLNAASRMDDADAAFRLLTTSDPVEAQQLVSHLESLNASRKALAGAIVRKAKKTVHTRFSPDERVVLLGDPEWKPSLLGLAANSIVNERGGMVCLWGKDALGRIKGSCRSDGSVSVVETLAGASDAFIEYGAHAASGGFSALPDAIHTLQEKLAGAAAEIPTNPVREKGSADALLSLREVSLPLFREVSRLAPFGAENPKPLFRIARARVVEVRQFGKDKNHVEVQLSCPESGERVRAYDFFRAPKDFTHAPEGKGEVAVLASIERDTYRGGLSLRLADILPL